MMERQTIKNQYGDITQFPDRAFLFTSYITSKNQKEYFLSVLEYIKSNYTDSLIVLSSHLPVDEEILKYVDSFILSKNNPAINRECKTIDTINRLTTFFCFPQDDDWDLRLCRPYIQHSYAHHLNKYDGLQYLKSQRIEYVHVLNYDLKLEKLEDLNGHYELLKNHEYDLVYHDCEAWLGPGTMNTELFSLRISACEDKLLEILSFQEYDNATDNTHEKTYFNLFENKKKFHIGSTTNFGEMGVSRFEDELGNNVINKVEDINTVIMPNLTMYLFTLSNNVMDSYQVDDAFYESLDTIDSNIAMHNNCEKDVALDYIFYDENFVEAYSTIVNIQAGTFHYYNIPDVFRYCKIRLNGSDRNFFDIRNPRNYAVTVRSPRIK